MDHPDKGRMTGPAVKIDGTSKRETGSAFAGTAGFLDYRSNREDVILKSV
jgi:hypothetical protein